MTSTRQIRASGGTGLALPSKHSGASPGARERGSMMTVELSAVQNPDFAEPRLLPGDEERVVGSLGEAADVCRAWIAEHDLGSGNWTGGVVRDDDRTMLARISYNGRVWPTE